MISTFQPKMHEVWMGFTISWETLQKFNLIRFRHVRGVIGDASIAIRKFSFRDGMNSSAPFHLPDEIIEEEILSRLPVQRLLKFRCVCKSWCCLISTERFIESHLKIYGKNAGQKIIFTNYGYPNTIHHCPLYSLIPGSVVEYADLFSPTENTDLNGGYLHIVGSCNGLICIIIRYTDHRSEVRLWNPSTRKYLVLKRCMFGLYGFGFDEFSKDYKVVFQQYGSYLTQVYSLKSNTWKFTHVSLNVDPPKTDYLGIFANGKLHWEVGGRLVCFDLTKEVWEETVDFNGPLMGVLGGFLSIRCSSPEDRMDIWILKHQTWDKVFTIKYRPIFPSGVILMLCIGPNDTMLVVEQKSSTNSIKIHGMETNSYQPDADGTCLPALNLLKIHHESLVQLPVDEPDMRGHGGVNGVNEALDRAQRVVISSLDQPPDSLFASARSHSFLGSRGMLNFGAVNGGNRLGSSFFQSHDQDDSGDEFMDEYFNPQEKKRRLSVQQVQFLEKSFDADNKLEPDRKVQLAKELSLLPRQIAIWFQNRRARWKTRQLEADYEALHANYESLKTEYDNILKENEKLKTEILCLKNSGLAGGTDKMNPDSGSNVASKEAMADMFCEDQESKASKNEEESSTKSDFDYGESPLLAVGIQSPPFESGDSSYDFDISHSDLMQNGEDELYQLDCVFSKIEGSYCLQPGSAFYYGFQVEDQCFSLWS